MLSPKLSPMLPLRAAALAAAVLATAPQLARADSMHVTTGQGAREAIVLQSVRTPAPTVIVLHGATITAALTARSSGFAERPPPGALPPSFRKASTGSGTTAGKTGPCPPSMTSAF
jgi:hypothetical protein